MAHEGLRIPEEDSGAQRVGVQGDSASRLYAACEAHANRPTPTPFAMSIPAAPAPTAASEPPIPMPSPACPRERRPMETDWRREKKQEEGGEREERREKGEEGRD